MCHLLKRCSRIFRLLAVSSVIAWIASGGIEITAQESIPLDEDAVVSVLNRTARVRADGSWRIDNVPANMGPVRVRATSVKNGISRFGQSDFITLEANIDNGFSPFDLSDPAPVPSALQVTPLSPVIPGAGETVQLTVIANYPDGSTKDVTASLEGTSYTISNPNTATITQNGLITGVASGTVVVSVINDGAIAMIQVRVVFGGDSDGDGIPDDLEIAHGLNPNNPVDAEEDFDKDGLTNKQELLDYGTNIRLADTDGDGILDSEEVFTGEDGFITSPLLADTDGDGVRDLLEIQSGSDPTNPASLNLAQALQSLEVTPASFVLTVNSIIGEASRQLSVIGHLKDGTTIDLASTTRGTFYNSSDLFIANFGSPDGRVFAGSDSGSAIVTVSNSGFSDTAEVIVSTFTPEALSTISIPGYANNVDVNGGFAYVAAGSAGLQIVNVSNPNAPAIVGSVDTPGNANDVRVAGTLAFVADGASGLQVIDVSVSTSPIIVGSVNTPGEAQDVFVIGTRVYVADGASGVQIVDVSSPSSPTILGSVDTPGTAKGVAATGNLVLVADGFPSSAVRVIDASNPASPIIIGSVAIPSEAKDLVVENMFAYVAAYTGGLQIVDFGTPTAPFIIGGLPNSFVPRDVELSGQFALFAEQLFPNAVPIVNVSNPSNPLFNSTLDFSPLGDYAGTGIAVDRQYVYMTGEFFIVGPENGVSGNTRLFIGQYLAIEDTEGVAPLVSITSPTQGGNIVEGNSILVQANASDDIGVAAVTFLVNGLPAFTDTGAPFQFNYTVPLGVTTVTFGAQAIDYGSNIGSAANVVANVIPNPPPTVTITSPTGTVLQGEAIVLSADATDDTAVVSVLFKANGVSLPLDSTAPYSVNYIVPTDIASLTIEAIATDNAGKQGTDIRTIDVVPDPLTVVVGQVLTPDGLPAQGALVTVFNVFTDETDENGLFEIAGVPTILGGIIGRASLTIAGETLNGQSAPVAPVRGGITDLDTIYLSPGCPEENRNPIIAAHGFQGIIYSVHPTTHEITNLKQFGGLNGFNGLSRDPASGKLYAIGKLSDGPRVIIELDEFAGTFTVVGDPGVFLADMAFRQDGTLYVIVGNAGSGSPEASFAIAAIGNPSPGEIYTVNLEDGSLTPTGLVGSSGGGHSLAFHPGNGLLYHTFGDNIETIDTGTGAITFIGNTGVSQFNSVIFDPANDIFLGSSFGNFYAINPATAEVSYLRSVGGTLAGMALGYCDPLTTVFGRVIDVNGNPVPGSTVSVTLGQTVKSSLSGPDGIFMIPDVKTTVNTLRARAVLVVGDTLYRGWSMPVPPVAGGPTVVGDIVITESILIENGSFETGDFSGFTPAGNAQVVQNLGPNLPTDGQFMALISTGFGAVNNSTSSIETDGLIIPPTAQFLVFDYNFLTADYFPYQDFFQVRISTPNGQITHLVAQVTDANLPAPGTGYSLMTGFREFRIDVSQFHLGSVQFELSVSDFGDTSVDSVTLIDNLHFE